MDTRKDILNSMQAVLQRCVDAITEFTAQNITKDVVQRMQNCNESDDMKSNVTQADPATTTTTRSDYGPTRPGIGVSRFPATTRTAYAWLENARVVCPRPDLTTTRPDHDAT